MTYGGGPEGGIARLASSMTSAKLWYVWHRDWGRPASVLRIPRELAPVCRHDDGYEAIKLVMEDDYQVGENEYFLDDLEDSAEDQEDSEHGLRNDVDDDDDDEANEGREDDTETEAEDEVEDEMEDEADKYRR